ncbi:MAG: hypothetical protein FWE67_01180 [Planctomycetaceae bacterium]|nr:hypothetical protein [Planctomycetaceae bacterium]
MTHIKLTAKDGSPVEFIKKDPMQGGVKDVYWHPQKQYVVAFFRKKLDIAGKDRIEKLVGTYRERIFGLAGGEYWKKIFCWPEKIVEHEGLTGIIVPKYEECYFFAKGTSLEGAEKEGKWFASPKNFNRFVPPEEKGDLIGYMRICLSLARGTRRLHLAGLSHSDLSYKNCLVDPKGGNACIIDIDGLVVPGLFPPDVVGTPDFIAPEVMQTLSLPLNDTNRKLPSRLTDLHALPVLIYQYLFHRHPLRGSKVWDMDSDKQEKLEMGEKALFIEHPTDGTNRRKVENGEDKLLPWINTAKIPYTIAGPYLKALFDTAFIEGLHNPAKRPSADEWEAAVVKTMDMIQPCQNKSCPKKWFVFDNKSKPVCPYCGTPFKGVLPVLDFYSDPMGKGKYRPDNHRLMVFDGVSLYKWHSDRNVFPSEKVSAADSKRVGYFRFWKGKWMLVNEGLPTMKNITAGKEIPIGQGVDLTDGLQLLLSNEPTGRIVNIQIVNG